MKDRTEYLHRYYLAHRREILERRRRYQAEHPDRRRASQRRYAATVKAYAPAWQKQRARQQQWQRARRLKEPEVMRIEGRMRRRGRPVTWAEARWMLREYGPGYPLHRYLGRESQLWVGRQMRLAKASRGAMDDREFWVFEAWEREARQRLAPCAREAA